MPTSTPQSENQDPDQSRNQHILDKENVFLIYATLMGDRVRTAHACGISEGIVKMLAEAGGWDAKLKPLIDLKASSRPGDVERAINRAQNFVQAHRFQIFLEKVVTELTGLSQRDINAYIFATETDKDGLQAKKFTTRALADLASALLKCHEMTYLALGDSGTERRERGPEDGAEASAGEMHVRIARAMAEAGGPSATIQGKLATSQLQFVQEHAPCPVVSITLPTDV